MSALLPTPPVSAPVVEMVSELFIPGETAWNEPLLRQLFEDAFVHRILAIPLPECHEEDLWLWSHTNNGDFSVSSCYKLALSLAPDVSSDLMGPHSSIWTRIWDLETPNKVKFFAWRVASDVLPVRRRLCDRNIPITDACPCCQDGIESVLHLLRDCSFAKSVWEASPFPPVSGLEGITAQDWFLRVAQMLSARDWAEFVIVCWNVWYARNRRIWHDELLSPMDLIHRSHSYSHSFWATMARKRKSPAPTRAERVTRWQPPGNSFLKLNVDGAIFDGSKQTGMGAVVRNSAGEVLYAKSAIFPGLVTSLEAELRGLCHALRWLRALRLRDVIVEVDSLLMVQLLYNPVVTRRDEIGVLARSCKHILSQLSSVRVCHIYRGGNKVAHALARSSKTLGGENVWYNLIPAHVAEEVAADL